MKAHVILLPIYAGDDLKDEKVALVVLCKALSRKGNDNAILYIYEECKVKCMCSVHIPCIYSLASFPGLPHLQFLIASSMQKRRGKAWGIFSRDTWHS